MQRILVRSGRGFRDYLPCFLGDSSFDRRFPTEEACRDFLFQSRWPDGFECRRCGTAPFRWLDTRRLLCLVCHKPTALTGGTILHRTRKPLRAWFRAAYLMSQPCGSARMLQEQLQLTYKVAWTWAHKLRTLMALKTTLDEPARPFQAELRELQRLSTAAPARRRWFAR